MEAKRSRSYPQVTDLLPLPFKLEAVAFLLKKDRENIHFRIRGQHFHLLFFNRMNKGDATGMQTDAPVWIAPPGPIFPVPLYNTANTGQLGPDLVMTSGLQLDFKQVITIRGCQFPIMKPGVFGTAYLAVVYIAFILFGVPGQVMIQGTGFGLRTFLNDGMVDLLNFFSLEESSHPA